MKHRLFSSLLIIALVALVGGCATAPEKSSLELQAFQKKNFDTSKKVAFASVMSVFQDMGYTVKQASVETGFIQAASPTKSFVLFGAHMTNTEATAFVEDITPTRTSIRLNFVQDKEDSSGYGMKSKTDKPILDQKVYEGCFKNIQEAIFIREASK